MKPKNPLEKKHSTEAKRLGPKRKKKTDEWEIDLESDYPVHEKYTKEEPVKEG